MNTVIQGLTVPFLGTALGSACVFFLKNRLNARLQQVLAGFAAGVMTAASVWSLLIPSIERSADMGRLAFLPAVTGFMLGMALLLLLDKLTAKMDASGVTGRGLSKNALMFIAVTIHNIPEGMAVGVVCADMLFGTGEADALAAALAFGIAIQNFPEGAIISMPLRADGMSRRKAFLLGALSGAAEPLGALLTIAAAGFVVPLMPYFLSFAAGAMIYVVIAELVPEMSPEMSDNCGEQAAPAFGKLSFALGFAAMMMLDVMLG